MTMSIAEEYSLFTSQNPDLRLYSLALRKSLHVSKSWRNHLIVFWPAVRDLIVNCLFYRDRWAFSCGQARLLTKEKFLCPDAEHKSHRKCWQEKKNQIFYKQVPSYLSLYRLMYCKKEAYHSPRNCAQKGSMSHIFFLVSLSHWKLVLFVDWKLRLVTAVESVIHRIPKT